MKKLLLFFFFLSITSIAFGRAYFAPKEEMIAKSDIIAIVNITEIIRVIPKPEGQWGGQEVRAVVERVLKGNPEKEIIFFVSTFFPCAITEVKQGQYLVFLEMSKKLQGCNWHLSYRPIVNDKIEWYENNEPYGLNKANLEEVLLEVKGIVGKQQAP